MNMSTRHATARHVRQRKLNTKAALRIIRENEVQDTAESVGDTNSQPRKKARTTQATDASPLTAYEQAMISRYDGLLKELRESRKEAKKSRKAFEKLAAQLGSYLERGIDADVSRRIKVKLEARESASD